MMHAWLCLERKFLVVTSGRKERKNKEVGRRMLGQRKEGAGRLGHFIGPPWLSEAPPSVEPRRDCLAFFCVTDMLFLMQN